MRILVVDDEVVSRQKMVKIMESYGECVAAEDAYQALQLFRKALKDGAPFSLVTLDVSMPGMDGTEALFEIRSFEAQNRIIPDDNVKVIMVTARADKDTVITSIQAGCNDYIAKPFERQAVAEKLARMGLIETAALVLEYSAEPKQDNESPPTCDQT